MKRKHNILKQATTTGVLGSRWLRLAVLSFIICHLSLRPAGAQTFIGYLSQDSVLKSMPGYLLVEQQMDTLHQAYAAELKRVEDEFNQKYEAFLEGRKDYPRTILLKRQTELQQLLQQNVDFKARSQKELAQARSDALAPLLQRLKEAIAAVARQHQLAVVVNTDANACPFLDPDLSLDVTQEVMDLLHQ